MSDPYKILGISRDATDDEVKKAYRQLSRKYHPDANVNNPNKDKAEEMFKLVQQAYQQVMYERQHPYSSAGQGSWSRPGSQSAGRPSGSSGTSSGQTWQDENGTTYTYYGNFEDFSDFWNEFFSSYGFGTQGASQDNSEEAIHLRAAASYINHGMFQEALNVLSAMEERSAQWYYYSAAANSGIGNDAVALEHAQRAASMDPSNPNYQSMLQQLQSGNRWYTSRSQTYGGPVSAGGQCMRVCAAYLCINALCNICCCGGGSRGC
ncbi:MAG: DnaJ domain-containing protein [Eubacteriales bacterium]|nr:DnaJ domain-containing protein [Eubacteriales bacterium]